ncbi:MAG: vWA domain-containing protein, partial [Gammaproteobacteria bacterium]
MLDQSGSILDTDPTNARLYSAKAFMQTIDAGSGDAVLLTAFAGPGHGALIPTVPLWFGGTFTTDGVSYFDELDALGDQAGGDTPLYRVLFPEPADANNNPGFTQGLIDYTAANAPAGLRKAVVIFSDGDDNECTSVASCSAKRQRVIDKANTANVSLFTIGFSNQVNFEALAEIARETDGVFLFAENAEQLIPLYGSLGDLLSRSLPTYTMRWTVRADTDGTFVSGHSVFGRLQINGGGSTVTVPFIVGVP